MGPVGVLAWGGLFVVTGYFMYKQVFQMNVSKPSKEE